MICDIKKTAKHKSIYGGCTSNSAQQHSSRDFKTCFVLRQVIVLFTSVDLGRTYARQNKTDVSCLDKLQ